MSTKQCTSFVSVLFQFYFTCNSRFSPQPDTSLCCETKDTGLIHRVVCTWLCIPTKDGQAELTTWHT